MNAMHSLLTLRTVTVFCPDGQIPIGPTAPMVSSHSGVGTADYDQNNRFEAFEVDCDRAGSVLYTKIGRLSAVSLLITNTSRADGTSYAQRTTYKKMTGG